MLKKKQTTNSDVNKYSFIKIIHVPPDYHFVYWYSEKIRPIYMKVSRGSQWGCSKHGTRFFFFGCFTLNPIETLYKQHGYLNKNNSRHTVNFFPFSRHTVNFLDVSRHTLNPIETLLVEPVRICYFRIQIVPITTNVSFASFNFIKKWSYYARPERLCSSFWPRWGTAK